MDREVRRITTAEAKSLVAEYHYLGKKPFRCSLAYGIINGASIEGAAIFHGVSAPETVVGAFGLSRADQQGFWELGRLVLEPILNGGNWGTWFLSRAIKQLRKAAGVRAIISYADSSRHVGAIYQSASFTYCGLSTAKKDFYVDGRLQERGKTKGVDGVWLPRPRKHRYIKVFDHKLNLKWPQRRVISERTTDTMAGRPSTGVVSVHRAPPGDATIYPLCSVRPRALPPVWRDDVGRVGAVRCDLYCLRTEEGVLLNHQRSPEFWDNWFIDLASKISTASKDPSTQTGAVIVAPDRTIISTGFNGFPRAMPDYPEYYADREEKYSRIIHCEMNALLVAHRSVEGATLYTWPFISCDRCFVHMVQAGIIRFVAPVATGEQLDRWAGAFNRVYKYAAECGVEILEVE